jgi:uncharacterized protein (DUF433 family)
MEGARRDVVLSFELKGFAMNTVNWRDHIVCDPAVLGGKPILKGTRLAVEFVLEILAAG